ncbi:sucrase ferredoxin [Rubrobacter indicoceani]|uniref:sucrase ferredoxin n=1 Tax=Rubrobacter indicoceani TaxID=2051957 RepID=UPI000E5A9712|nr:sucrase ferredoxin [Rubrobacter indicoceani]
MQTDNEVRLCSVVSREAGDDPAGSGGGFRTALLVEVPPPWNREVSASRRFPAGLREALAPHDRADDFQKLTAFLPENGRSVPGYTRIFRYSRPAEESRFSCYGKTEYLVPDKEVVNAVDGIFSGSDEHVVAGSGDVRELFVCTHNNRDVCCGRFGTELHRALKEIESENLRVWRCSHLGGHRFAPTMLDLPTGVVWGHVEPELAARLLQRELPVEEAGRFFRGWAGIREQAAQIADRELLTREGWGWLDTPRSATVAPRIPGSGGCEVTISTPDSTYSVTIEPAGSVMTLASSGTDPLEEVRQYRVASLEKS